MISLSPTAILNDSITYLRAGTPRPNGLSKLVATPLAKCGYSVAFVAGTIESFGAALYFAGSIAAGGIAYKVTGSTQTANNIIENGGAWLGVSGTATIVALENIFSNSLLDLKLSSNTLYY